MAPAQDACYRLPMLAALLVASAVSVVNAAARDLKFHGVVRIERSGRVLVHKGYGVRSDTDFWIGPISRSFTAALILRLADLGALRLDDPVSKFIRGGPDLRIDELLTDTSGLPGERYAADGIRDRGEAARAIFALPPQERGKFEESDDGYVLLAILAEKAGQAPFDQLLESQVLVPGGLPHTGFWPRCVRGVHVARQAEPPERELMQENWGFKGPQGICSSAWDLARFMVRLAGGTIVTPRARELLWQKAVPLGNGEYAGRGFYVDDKSISSTGSEEGGHNGVVKWYPQEHLVLVVLSDVPEPKQGPAPSEALANALEKKLDELR